MGRNIPGKATANAIKAIKNRLKEINMSAFKAARKNKLPDDSIRYILNGSSPSLERANDIAQALGLEFYFGPPRNPEATVRQITCQKEHLNREHLRSAVIGLERGLINRDKDPVPEDRAKLVILCYDLLEEKFGAEADADKPKPEKITKTSDQFMNNVIKLISAL